MTDVPTRAALAATRFGMGARPGEIAAVGADASGWLEAQIRPEGADQPQGTFKTASEALSDYRGFVQERRAARQEAGPEAPAGMTAEPAMAAAAAAGRAPRQGGAGMEAVRAERRDLVDEVQGEFAARARLGATTAAGFRERWALFWANHFTVSGVKLQVATAAGAFEREAIRPHVFGRFSDLLLASTRHPAMLLYLDQAQSIGPGSTMGMRRARGLNENLAREILELHTLGADAGYSQADVTEFARALTGWSVGGGRMNGPAGGYVYVARAHEPGARDLLGRRFPEGGEGQARAMLEHLAAHPKTARRLARKIVAHFVADDPPAALVDRLEGAWTRSGGRLDEVARALVKAPEAWDPAPRKLKTPYEFLVSSHRAAGTAPMPPRRLSLLLTQLGQKPYSPPSPKGWPDQAAVWAAPDALVKRLEFAQAFAAAAPAGDPVEIARGALGARLSQTAEQAIRRAESREEAFTLLLMSPEFQRR
jgi:uncharacterized protein (DUF1800 family)